MAERAAPAFALACVALACLPESFAAVFSWDRSAIAAGERWRLWTGHLVHFGHQHAVLDAIVLFAAGTVVERSVGWMGLMSRLLIAAPIVSLALLAVPSLEEYRGASALATMVAMMAGMVLWRDSERSRPFLLTGGIAFTAAGVLQACGLMPSAAGLPFGVAVAWQAHVAGAACAMLPGSPLTPRRQ